MTSRRNQETLLQLASLSGNNICADCKTRSPRYTSYNLGIFICESCAGIHRKIGTHITRVKSLTADDWTSEQVENMKSTGNVRSNAIYNPNETLNPPPLNLAQTERDSEIEQYIRAKYQYKRFINKSALVASKLGPSRSASSAPSAPSRQPASLPRPSTQPTNPHNAPPSAYTQPTNSHNPPPAPLPRSSTQPINPHNAPPSAYTQPTNSHNPPPSPYTQPTNSHNPPPAPLPRSSTQPTNLSHNPPPPLPRSSTQPENSHNTPPAPRSNAQPANPRTNNAPPAPLPRSNTQPTNTHNVSPTSSRSSYPVPSNPAQALPAAQRSQPVVGAWDDINSRQGTSQNSSLPLQYQQPPPTYSQGNHSAQMPPANGPISANVYPVGVTANPYQPNQVRTNPFSHQQSQPPFVAPLMASSFPTTSTTNSQSFAQQSFGVPQSSASLGHQSSTFRPSQQASMQTSMQIQSPSGQGFISPPPNQLFSGGQSQFPQNHSSVQQYISHSPQQMQSSPNPQFMYSSAPPAQPQMAASGHGQYLGMTTMQMPQQALQQPQQQQQQHMQMQMQMQQQQHHHQPMQQQQQQPLGQNYVSSMQQPQMMSGQASVYGQQAPYSTQGGFPPPHTGGQWGTR